MVSSVFGFGFLVLGFWFYVFGFRFAVCLESGHETDN